MKNVIPITSDRFKIVFAEDDTWVERVPLGTGTVCKDRSEIWDKQEKGDDVIVDSWREAREIVSLYLGDRIEALTETLKLFDDAIFFSVDEWHMADKT